MRAMGRDREVSGSQRQSGRGLPQSGALARVSIPLNRYRSLGYSRNFAFTGQSVRGRAIKYISFNINGLHGITLTPSPLGSILDSVAA